jgi:hypothetical protein
VSVLNSRNAPEFVAQAYTWCNPITVYDEPMPSSSHLQFPEDADHFPFMYTTSTPGPNGEAMASVEAGKRVYLTLFPRIAYEKVSWKTGAIRHITVKNIAVEAEENLSKFLKRVISM